ncbi:MAG: helix-turn-helix transcriptional regulator [Bacteroidales bacterium]|nr:helix-turn-helix transcriptional regulator [Bacteroidales bacterium]
MLNHYKKTGKIDVNKFLPFIEQLKVISHPVRFGIIVMLTHNKKMTVSQIHSELRLQQAAASNHLKLLKASKLILCKRIGKNSFYFVNEKTFIKMAKTLSLDFIPHTPLKDEPED